MIYALCMFFCKQNPIVDALHCFMIFNYYLQVSAKSAIIWEVVIIILCNTVVTADEYRCACVYAWYQTCTSLIGFTGPSMDIDSMKCCMQLCHCPYNNSLWVEFVFNSSHCSIPVCHDKMLQTFQYNTDISRHTKMSPSWWKQSKGVCYSSGWR